MLDRLDALEKHYASLERDWATSDRASDYARLVVPNGNSNEPFHRWFHIKEAFSARLLETLDREDPGLVRQSCRMIDPFAGGGTSLLSAIDLLGQNVGFSGHGVERNPFLWHVARTKVRARVAPSSLVADLRDQVGAVVDGVVVKAGTEQMFAPSPTLSNREYFPLQSIQELAALRDAIERQSTGLARDILLLCLCAAVEPAGKLRRDGRALRFEPLKSPTSPLDVFLSRVKMAITDLEGRSSTAVSDVNVDLGDGRRPDLSTAGPVDLAVFSPPYPNNIDYTEIYKIESWVLGCYESAADMKAQRHSTVRSHPSVAFAENYFSEAEEGLKNSTELLLRPVLDALPTDRYMRGRRRLVLGYFDDMLQVFARLRKMMAPGGRLVFVVGNSAHGASSERFVIAADILMAALAQTVGWEVSEIRVSRHLGRRSASSSFLRESVVSLRC